MNLITDRNSADLSRRRSLRQAVKERTATPEEVLEWLSGLKGAYNATDLNRVGAALAYVSGRLIAAGYAAHVSPKLDWSVTDVPTKAEMAAYLADVSTIRSALAVVAPSVPGTMDKLTFGEANDIERILEIVDGVIGRMLRTVDLGWALGIAHIEMYGGI